MSRATYAPGLEERRGYTDMAIKVQKQIRHSILALHSIQNPQPTVVQQSVAFNQQVNNHPEPFPQKTKLENELSREVKHAKIEYQSKTAPRTHPDFYYVDTNGKRRFNKAKFEKDKLKREFVEWRLLKSQRNK